MQSPWRRACSIILVASGLWLVAMTAPTFAQSSVLDLNDAIQSRRKEARELQEKIAQYKKKISTTQKKAASLTNQIDILESNISKAELEIKTKEVEISQLGLESELAQRELEKETQRMEAVREEISAALRRMQHFGSRPYVEIVLARNSFSELFDQVFFIERLGDELRRKLKLIKDIRSALEQNRELLKTQKNDTAEKKKGLEIMQGSLEHERRLKEILLGETKSSESEFQRLLGDLRAAESAIDADIVTLEKKIRQRLDIADKLAGESGVLSWPVAPIGGLSSVFHDPEYPFRYIFEHGGIDIRTPQGTPVRAAASGYAAKAYNGGLGIKPSYVMLVHGQQMATVYMHLSSIAVAPDTFVARGDVIGNSGGAPRTPGAGRWTTGPHLHFETRLNGVPVDPLGYLP